MSLEILELTAHWLASTAILVLCIGLLVVGLIGGARDRGRGP